MLLRLLRAPLRVAPVFVLLGVMFFARATDAAPVVYAESAMVKVRPASAAKTGAAVVTLTAARNEFVSFQVVVHGQDTGAKQVSASLGALQGPNGASIGGTELTLYRVDLLNVTAASFPDSATGLWPDALVPDVDEIAHEKRSAFPFDVGVNQARAIWVDVHIPEDAAPGIYSGAAVVNGTGLAAKIPVTVQVLDATLPSTASLSSAFLLAPGMVCAAHTGVGDCGGRTTMDALLGRYERMALEHRISLPNIFLAPSETALYDANYAAFFDGKAATRLVGARVTNIQYTGPRESAKYAAFSQHMKAKGWFDRAFDYTGDEPPYGISYAEIARRLSVVRAGDKDLATLVTTTAANAQKAGILEGLQVVVPVINLLDGTAAPYLGDQRSGYDPWLAAGNRRVWMYQSCMSQGCAYGTTAPENTKAAGWPSYLVDAASGRNRAMQWVAYLERVHGELYYETAQSLTTAWKTQYQYNGNGDGNLFYPGTVAAVGGSTEVPIASIRLKLVRQGMQDYEWLKKVEGAGDPDFATATARALAPSASQVSNDGAAYDNARLKLIQRYLELTHVTAGPLLAQVVPEVAAERVPGKPAAGVEGSLHLNCSSAPGDFLPIAPFALVGLVLLRRRSRTLSN